jgi:hypothetical protein
MDPWPSLNVASLSDALFPAEVSGRSQKGRSAIAPHRSEVGRLARIGRDPHVLVLAHLTWNRGLCGATISNEVMLCHPQSPLHEALLDQVVEAGFSGSLPALSGKKVFP